MHTPVFTFLKKIPHLFAQKLPHPYVCAHLQFEKNNFFWTLIQKTVLIFLLCYSFEVWFSIRSNEALEYNQHDSKAKGQNKKEAGKIRSHLGNYWNRRKAVFGSLQGQTYGGKAYFFNCDELSIALDKKQNLDKQINSFHIQIT